MREILADLVAWVSAGRRFVVARVVDLEGSGPRDPGAAMAVSDTGEVVGSVSGGCVESAVVAEALEMIESGEGARRRTFGYSDEQAFAVGLTCGGTIHLLLQSFSSYDGGSEVMLEALHRAVENEQPAALASVIEVDQSKLVQTGAQLGAAHLGASMVVGGSEDEVIGSLGNESLDRAVRRDAKGAMDAGRSETRHYGPSGEARQSGVEIFIEALSPPPHMVILGAVDFTVALAKQAKLLGYHVSVCDARPVFATAKRFPMADEVVSEWPDRYLEKLAMHLGPRDAICVLTHDPKFDIPALRAALSTKAGYVGAMGSRRTHSERMRGLEELGIAQADLERVHGPIGLNLGARTPEETAVAIAAEIIALNSGRISAGTLGPLRDTYGPIHEPR